MAGDFPRNSRVGGITHSRHRELAMLQCLRKADSPSAGSIALENVMNPTDAEYEDQQRIDSICGEFENAWKSGESPNLDKFVRQAPQHIRLATLAELVILDSFYRSRELDDGDDTDPHASAGQESTLTDEEMPTPTTQLAWDEYVARFPELADMPMPDSMVTYSPKRKLVGGRFKNLRTHASGGLGRVSVANDIQFKRQVALKEMRSGLTSVESYRRRFMREAEITGQLEHPGIVPVYAMGTHENGDPYYAMRLIRGRTLSDAIKELHSTPIDLGFSRDVRQLINRFVDVCHSVSYAHSQGFIHRDIKPANIMLGDFGETLLVDWGLAKNLSEVDSTQAHAASYDTDDETQIGTVMGTPNYMSPEQSAGDIEQVGACSDIYGLGATLFHLISGNPPNDRETNRDQSTSPNTDGETADSANPTDSAMRPLLAICAKAMERTPSQRYESAADLANDIELVLFDEPIAIFRDSVGTRVRRWISRHQAVAAASAVGISFAFAGLLVLSWIRGVHADQLLAKNVRLDQMVVEETRLREAAQDSEARSDRTIEFLVNAMRSPDPNRDGREITVVDILDQSVSELDDASFDEDPLLRAQLSYALGRTFAGLGQLSDAEPLIEKAFFSYQDQYGPEHPTTLSAGDQLATIYRGRNDERALRFITELVDVSRTSLGEDAPETLQLRHTLAMTKNDRGGHLEAIKILESLIAKQESNLPHEKLAASSLMNDLAVAYYAAGEFEKAVEISKRVYELRTSHNDTQKLRTITAGYNYLKCLTKTTDANTVIQEYERLLKDARKHLGNEHFQTLRIMTNLGTAHLDAQNRERGLDLIKESLDCSQEIYGENHPRTIVAANSLGLALLNQGDYPATIEQFQKVYAHSLMTHGDDHAETLTIANNLASAYRLNGDHAKAVSVFEKTLVAQKRVLGPQHPHSIRSMLNLAASLQQASRNADAILVCRETYEIVRDSKGADHPNIGTALSLEAMSRLELKQFSEAKAALEECHTLRAVSMPGHWLRFYTMGLLGEAHLGLGDLDQAEDLLVLAYGKMLEQESKIPIRARVRLERIRDQLIRLYETKEMPEEAQKYRDSLSNSPRSE